MSVRSGLFEDDSKRPDGLINYSPVYVHMLGPSTLESQPLPCLDGQRSEGWGLGIGVGVGPVGLLIIMTTVSPPAIHCFCMSDRPVIRILDSCSFFPLELACFFIRKCFDEIITSKLNAGSIDCIILIYKAC